LYLNILAGRQPPEILPVKLLDGREKHGARRHVQPHRKSLRGEERFDEPLAEKDLDRLLQDGKEAAVMDANAALEQRQHVLHLGQGSILLGQDHHGVVEDLVDQLLLLVGVEVQLGHLKRVRLALLLAEGEDDDGGEVALHDHLDDFEDVGAVLHAALPAALVTLEVGTFFDHHGQKTFQFF